MQPIVVCNLDDLEEGRSFGVDVHENLALFVVKKYDQYFVYLNKCPHLGIRLEWQENQFLDMDTELIECSTHGALFEIETGNCIAGPCSGDQLTRISHTIKENQIIVELDGHI